MQCNEKGKSPSTVLTVPLQKKPVHHPPIRGENPYFQPTSVDFRNETSIDITHFLWCNCSAQYIFHTLTTTRRGPKFFVRFFSPEEGA